MSEPAILAATMPVIAALEELQAGYYIGGSVASSAHGLPRTTLDVDLVADLAAGHVSPFAQRLEEAYYLDQGAIRQAVRERSSFNLIHLATLFKVDVFPLKSAAFDQTAFKRARPGSLGDAGEPQVMLASPEDVVLHKLHWYRSGGEISERQWRDVIGVLKVQGDALDESYMRVWAERLEVSDLLDRAGGEAWDD